jgi:type VI secretion system secreted protein Hcp
MAIRAYMYVKDQVQGVIKGDVTTGGASYKEWIQVNDVTYNVEQPTDVATGQATGKVQHSPLVVSSPTGKHTPLVFEALAGRHNLPDVKISIQKPNLNGEETTALTIELTNAIISKMTSSLETLTSDAGVGLGTTLFDEYAFTFQKIELSWPSAGTTASDDWETPVA